MANKNDLRYVKTEALLRNTYLNYCRERKKTLTVTELCRIAQVNKSTFYMHYDNLEQLHRDVCRQIIRDLLQDNRELGGLFTDPEAFAHSLGRLFRTHILELNHLFPTWADAIDPMEEVILEMYLRPDTPMYWESDIRFCVGGALRLLSHSQSCATRERTIELIKKTLG